MSAIIIMFEILTKDAQPIIWVRMNVSLYARNDRFIEIGIVVNTTLYVYIKCKPQISIEQQGLAGERFVHRPDHIRINFLFLLRVWGLELLYGEQTITLANDKVYVLNWIIKYTMKCNKLHVIMKEKLSWHAKQNFIIILGCMWFGEQHFIIIMYYKKIIMQVPYYDFQFYLNFFVAESILMCYSVVVAGAH